MKGFFSRLPAPRRQGRRSWRRRGHAGLVLAGLLVALMACSDPSLGPAPTPRLVGPVPDEVGLTAAAGGSDSATITIGNDGRAPLTYALEGLPDWIAADNGAGTLAPGSQAVVTLEAGCSAASAGDTRSATLQVHSNDAERPDVEVPVTLTCDPADDPPPVASFTATPQSGPAPLEVAFDATESHAPAGGVAAYDWDFGDGATGEGATTTHTYDAQGTYLVTLRVRDDAGGEATSDATVQVAAPDASPPTARIEASPASGTERAPVTVTFTADAEDADGTVVQYEWRVDGASTEGDGATFEHTFADAGRTEVALVVSDDDGASTRVTLDYRVLPDLYAVPSSVRFDLGDLPSVRIEAEETRSWTVSSDRAWLIVDAPSGGEGTGTTDVTLSVDASGLAGASATATLHVDAGSAQLDVPVTLRLPDVGTIGGAPVELDASMGHTVGGSFTLGNDGTAPLAVEASAPASWLQVDPGSTDVPPGGERAFQVTATCGDVVETRQGEVALSFDDPDEPGATVAVSLSCQEPPESAYGMEIVFVNESSFTASQRQAVLDAAARWSEVVTGDLPSVTVSSGTKLCPDTGIENVSWPRYGGTIDDLLVFVAMADMDGENGTIGYGGPCRIRSGSELPYAGRLALDVDDVDSLEARGLLETTALHEMGHVLGIGTMWSVLSRDLVDPACPPPDGGPEPRFTGADATDAHVHVGGSGHPYVEGDGPVGTACGHWDNDRYGHELMTGYLSANAALSRVTIGSLADLGYQVDLGAADAYTVPAAGSLQGADRGLELRDLGAYPLPFEGE